MTLLKDRLLWREQSPVHPQRSIRGLYGDPYWVHNLDIVNELGGHRGCVNALSWSKSGQLLASGSDDTNIILHRYQSDGSTKPFTQTHEISTGHTANIFSVKFMPHSNDSTIISAAGDSEVRVFDIEYSARTRRTSTTGTIGFRGGETYNGVRYLSEGDTGAKVFRSHADRVKRIVTESSPFLFLTCSEDGEVRQWDLRLPSSAYPEPRSGRMLFTRRRASTDEHRGTVPPPLISYRRYRLDLNTISCSPSQPHYIALGGAHLHCFLHDRRMIGRDVSAERGSDSAFSIDTDFQGDMMGKATRCVRRFAPEGKKKMSRLSNGHITACKISDANPNEMVVSWSGDHIYSFDLLRSPDADDEVAQSDTVKASQKAKAGGSHDRKRKRPQAASEGEATSKQRRWSISSSSENNDDVALRVRYGNGQSEDIALEANVPNAQVEAARQAVLTPSQKRSLKIAKSVVKIRRLMFSLESVQPVEETPPAPPHGPKVVFRQAESICTKTLHDMDRIIKTWRYPVDPIAEEIALHKTLRSHRDRARRFVQAAGVLGNLLKEAPDAPEGESEASTFDAISFPSTEGPVADNNEVFRYDFLKAILAWLKGGTLALLEAFRKGPKPSTQTYRFPIPEDVGTSGIERYLIRHLLLLATEEPVPDLGRSRFEHDETRHLFPTERHAVTAFAHIIEVSEAAETPTEDAAGQSRMRKELMEKARSYNPATAQNFWGFKVARGLLMKAAEGVDFSLVDRAFGGLGRAHRMTDGTNQTDIDPDEEEQVVESAEFVRRPAAHVPASDRERTGSLDRRQPTIGDALEDATDSDEEALLLLSQLRDEILQSDSEDDEGDSDMDRASNAPTPDSSDEQGNDALDSDDDLSEDDGDDDDDAEAEGVPFGRRRLMWHSAAERAQLREAVDSDVPVSSHTRAYRGHCNVKTVKDVNFYGLNDEYVVSGSDSGHVFIWDRKTTKLLNILEGDGDIVNVIQGHPYEPMMAVSGIDHTVKIFSADNRAQRDARLGYNLAATQSQSEGTFPTIGRPRFPRPSRRSERTRSTAAQDAAQSEPLLGDDAQPRAKTVEDGDSADELADTAAADTAATDTRMSNASAHRGLASRQRMGDSYTILSQNDVDRQGGMHEAYITRGMLQQLAMHMRTRRANAGEGAAGDGGDDGEGGMIVIDDDNCSVM